MCLCVKNFHRRGAKAQSQEGTYSYNFRIPCDVIFNHSVEHA